MFFFGKGLKFGNLIIAHSRCPDYRTDVIFQSKLRIFKNSAWCSKVDPDFGVRLDFFARNIDGNVRILILCIFIKVLFFGARIKHADQLKIFMFEDHLNGRVPHASLKTGY